MIDREFDVRAYEEGYRAGKHDAQVEIERLRDEVREWRKMDDQIRKFIGGKRDGRDTLEIVKERFNDAAFARSMADNLERLILKQNERLQTENDRLRTALNADDQTLRLHMGEMTAQEMRTLKAGFKWVLTRAALGWK